MKVVENLIKSVNCDNISYTYSYRLIRDSYKSNDAYGIEIERADYKNDIIVNIDRDRVKLISPNLEKVRGLVVMLYENQVSPIHLIDIIGEKVDEWVADFENSSYTIKN
ncbi:hypothetical protein CPJCM30710_09470 [Clostridium polyendosporum]|uniref:Uncharacterized protein n=1 Tax=Clostridium polyendosporum TaxID=69208 RepID=A0A919RXQ3_9CLOT|nr:DUF6514 family protein [Clostridium polyendosporum]GIM28281.1 hypothetical protein CPJCM30710_09470 [Clostridium polyendosporum]